MFGGLAGWMSDWLTDSLVGWLACWMADWSAEWLVDWLIGWLAVILDGFMMVRWSASRRTPIDVSPVSGWAPSEVRHTMYNSCHIQSRHIDGHVTLVQVLRLFTQRSDVLSRVRTGIHWTRQVATLIAAWLKTNFICAYGFYAVSKIIFVILGHDRCYCEYIQWQTVYIFQFNL